MGVANGVRGPAELVPASFVATCARPGDRMLPARIDGDADLITPSVARNGEDARVELAGFETAERQTET